MNFDDACSHVAENREIRERLDEIRDRDPVRAGSLFAWEVRKAMQDYRTHEIPMTEHVPVTTPPEIEFNNREAPQYRTFGGHVYTYEEIAHAIHVYGRWNHKGSITLLNKSTGNKVEFERIVSPNGKEFLVGWDTVEIKGYRLPVTRPFAFVAKEGKYTRISLDSDKYDWNKTRCWFRENYKFAQPDSPYFGLRSPHLLTLLAILLRGEKINVKEKDIEAGKRRYARLA